MRNGTISGYISGGLLKDAGAQARGFVGIAFRIDDAVSSFEAVYLRPTNARADDQLRRNHSVQYISFPEFPWHRLREESPGMDETYADMVPGEWVHYRLEVDGETARLYLNEAEQPVLIVNDLKLGDRSGRVGFASVSPEPPCRSGLRCLQTARAWLRSDLQAIVDAGSGGKCQDKQRQAGAPVP